MRNLYTLALLTAGLVYGQAPVTHTARLSNIGSPQGIQEALTVLRTVADMRAVSADTANSAISYTGTANEVALADWIVSAIDVAGPMAPQQYSVPGAGDDIVKVIYLRNTKTPQGVQELLTQMRTVISVAKIFNVTHSGTFVMRGNSALIASGTWLMAQLDKPFDPAAAPATYAMGSNQVKVYYLHNITSPQSTQELLTAIRLQARVNHAFVSNGIHAIALLGDSDQIATANALVAQRDIPTAR
jgi:type II secretory pathway component GspD/PulD (secretin)